MQNLTSFPASRARALAGLLAAVATTLAALLAAPPAGAIPQGTARPNPTGHWKLFVSIDYETEGTVTASNCERRLTPQEYEEQQEREVATGVDETPAKFSLTASATQKASLRTVRPGTIEVHGRRHGADVFAQSTGAPPMKARTTVSGSAVGLGEGGEPAGCHPGEQPGSSQPFEPESSSGTVYVLPLSARGRLRGFTVEPEVEPWHGETSGPPGTPAQAKLPSRIVLELEATKKRLLSHSIPKLVFHRTKHFEASANEGGSVSSATGSLTYTVKLVRTKKARPRERRERQLRSGDEEATGRGIDARAASCPRCQGRTGPGA